jgi:hypothetical protein
MSLIRRSSVVARDLNDENFISSIQINQTIKDTVDKIVAARSRGQGAFTLTGLYGSGKSTFLSLISSVIGGEEKVSQIAAKRLGPSAKALAEAVNGSKGGRGEVLVALGAREAVTTSVARSLDLDANSTADEIVNAIQLKAASISGGLILIVDEFGKALEYAASSGGDLYALQLLAELGERKGGKVTIICCLHQSFRDYLAGADSLVTNEWRKVQGRFQDLPFAPTIEEQLGLISGLIGDIELRPTSKAHTDAAARALSSSPTSRSIFQSVFRELPALEPVAAVAIVGILKTLVQQNQRSVVAFFSSVEPSSYRAMIEAGQTKLYGLTHFFDYLEANHGPTLFTGELSSLWRTVQDGLQRLRMSEATASEVSAYKAIACLAMTPRNMGVAVSERLIELALPKEDKADTQASIAGLINKKLIVYRDYSQEYFPVEGSDFDVIESLKDVSIGRTDLGPEQLARALDLSPVLAKRFYHESGALKWCPIFVYSKDTSPEQLREAVAQFPVSAVLGVGRSNDEIKAVVDGLEPSVTVVAASLSSTLAIRALKDAVGLQKLVTTNKTLSLDKVAKREVSIRLHAAEKAFHAAFNQQVNDGEWMIFGMLHAQSGAGLNSVVSDVMRYVYRSMPRIDNELLARTFVSSTAQSGVNTLVSKLFHDQGQESLGIEGFPPEKGILESILVKFGLVDENYVLVDLLKSDPESPLAQMFEETLALIQASSEPLTMASIQEFWTAPPFGVPEGLHSLFAPIFTMTYHDRLSIYQQGVFRAALTEIDIEVCMQSPKDFALGWNELDESKLGVLRELARGLSSVLEANAASEEPLEIARVLVKVFDNLSPFSKKTRHLSDNAISLRTVLKSAYDPNKLLFEDIPRVLGDDQLSEKLALTMSELVNHPQQLALSYVSKLLLALGLSVTEASAKQVASKITLIPDTGEHEFESIRRALLKCSVEQPSLDLIEALTSKPEKLWTDLDLKRADVELLIFAKKFRRFSSLIGDLESEGDYFAVVSTPDNDVLLDLNLSESERSLVAKAADELEIALEKSGQDASILSAALVHVLAKRVSKEEKTI